MKNRFQAIVNDKIQVDLSAENALLFKRENNRCIRAIDGNNAIRAEIFAADFLQKKYTLRINATFYKVDLKNEIDLLIEELGLSANISAVSDELKAPMPGLIVEIIAKPGSEIHTGDSLLVLEAMKMENTLTSPRDGTVKSVLVNVSDAVEKGTVLIEFEHEENT